MALNLKAALGICLFFIAGLCYVVNRVALPSQALASQVSAIVDDAAGQPSEPVTFRARRLARQNPIESQRTASRQAAADAAFAETRVVVLPPADRQETPSKPALLIAEAPVVEASPQVCAAAAEPGPAGALIATRVVEESGHSVWEQPPVKVPPASLTAIEPPRAAAPPEPASANAPAAGAVASTYKVQKGDSLSRIARQVFGSSEPRYIRLLVEANPKIAKRIDTLFIGEELRLPSLAVASPDSPRPAGQRAKSSPALIPVSPPGAGLLAEKSTKPVHVAARSGMPASSAGQSVARRTCRSGKKAGSCGETAPQRWYTIRASDSLASIARDLLKDSRRWRELAEVNGLRDPNKIMPGKRIKLPVDAQPES